MKKTLSKLTSIAICAAMLFGTLPVNALASVQIISNTVSVNVQNEQETAGADAPVITQGASASLAFEEDGDAQTLALSATYAGSGALTWSVSVAPSLGSASVDSSGTVTYTPDADAFGDDAFTVTVTDESGGEASIAIAVAISAVNDPPVLPMYADVTVNEDNGAKSVAGWANANAGPANENTQSLFFHVTVNTNTALFTAGGSPAVTQDGTLTFTPAPEANGSASVTLYATDNAGGANTSLSRTFTVNVLPVNDAPVNTVLPQISGQQNVGSVLSATQGTWNDDLDGNVGTLTYETMWQRATDSSGADASDLSTGDSYRITAADSHHFVRVLVTVTDSDATGTITAQEASPWSLLGNTAPAITETQASIATAEDVAGTLTLHASDEDGDTLTWSASTPAMGSVTVTDSEFSYTPNKDENGTDTFTVTVSDGFGGTDTLLVNVTVAAVNDTPVFTVGDNVTVAEDSLAQSFEGWAKDITAGADNESSQDLTFTVTDNTNISLFEAGGEPTVSAAGTLTFTPKANVNGVATVTLYLSDDAGGANASATQSFTITVSAENDTPVNTVLPAVTGTHAVGEVLTADSGTWDDSNDTDAGTYAYGWEWQSATNDSGTNLQTLGTGDSYTLTSAESHLYVRVLVTVTNTDSAGTVTEQAASMWTLVQNTSPVISETSPTIATNEDTAGAIPLHATDADADTLTWSVSVPAKGTASVADGLVTYTPGEDHNGEDVFTVTVTDGYGGTASVDVSVTISDVNDTPTFTVGDSQTVVEDYGTLLLPNWVKAMSVGPADEAGQALTFSVVGNTNATLFAAGGVPEITPEGTLTFTPAADAYGVATLTVQVSDNGGGANTSATQTFTVTVTPLNDVPTFTKGADQAVLEDCDTVTITDWVVAQAPGPDNESAQALTFHTSNDNPALFTAGGQPAVTSDGTLTFTPAADANGNATVLIYVTDNGSTLNAGDNNTSEIQTFSVSVSPVNDLPSFTVGANRTVAEDCGPQTVENWIKAMSAGPENEADQKLAFTVTQNSNPGLFTVGGEPDVSSQGTLTFTPAQDAYGTATVTLNVSDGSDADGTSATQTFTITVTPQNDLPVITGDATFTTDEDTAYAYTFTVADVEDAADALTIAYATGDTSLLKKTNMALTGSGSTRTLTVTPEPDRNGTLNLTLTVTDSQGGTTTKTVAMNIALVNDAPTISTIANRVTDEETSTGAIGFTIGDVDTAVATCTVTAESDNEALVANTAEAIVLGGSGASRTVTLNPSLNQTGTANITVTVSDGSLTAQTTFALNVNTVNDAPTLTAFSDVTINEDAATAPIQFTVADVDNMISELTVTAATSDTAMIPRANIALSAIAADGTGTLTLTPVANAYGTANMTVTVKDKGGKLSTQTFVLKVLEVNDQPVLSAIDAQSMNEDTEKTITVTVSDIDDDTSQLTLTATASTDTALVALSGVAVAAGTGGTRNVTLKPLPNQHGTTYITLQLTDDAGSFTTRTFPLTVNSVNDKPTFTKGANVLVDEDYGPYTATGWATGITTGAANEDQGLTFALKADNEALFTKQPEINPETGNLTFTPAPDACGVANITATLTDSGGATTANVTFTITISPINDAPVAQGLNSGLDTDEDQQLSGNLRATDVDANPLTYELVSATGHGVTSLSTDHGQVTLNASTGTFVYVPNKDYFQGVDTFYFRAFDGTLYSNEAPVEITFSGINDPPAAKDGTVTIAEDKTDFAGTLAGLVSDVDNTTLAYSVVTGPDNGGKLTLNTADGTYTYVPAADFYGVERFTFRAYDGNIYSNTATVTITVTPENDAPVTLSETISVNEGQTLNGLFKARDVELDAITYALLTSPAPDGFTLVDADTGAFTYNPPVLPTTAMRTVTVQFTATDANGAAGTGVITINVHSVNLAPVRAAGSPAVFTADEDVALNGNLGVTDPNGDTLVYTLLSPVHNGTMSEIDANGNFTYTSSKNYNGTDRFTFLATDPLGLRSSIYTAQITVKGVNDKPEVYDQYYYTNKNTAVSDITPIGYDADGNSLTFSIETQPSHGLAVKNADGTFTYTPATDYSGDDPFTYTADDGHGGKSDPATVHVYVYGDGTGTGAWFNAIPNKSIPENTFTTVPISVTKMTVASVKATSSNQWLLDSGDISVTDTAGSFALTLTPNAYRTGQSVITVTVTSTSGATYVRSFILTVTRVNYAPTANDMTRTMDENTEMFEFVTGHDYNGDALTYAMVNAPQNGTLEFDADGTFHYKPNTNFFGIDTFTFTVNDTEATSEKATVTINVTKVPVAPSADSASFTTDEDTPHAGQLTGSEPHKGILIYHLVQNGRLGTVSVKDDGSYTYTPKANESGTDAFTFKTEGPTGLYSAVAKISITINAVNDVPVLVIKHFTAFEDQPVSGYLEATDADVGDTLTFEMIPHDGDLALGTLTLDAKTGHFVYTPNSNMNGTDSFRVRVKDLSSSSEPMEFTVVIDPINDAPIALDVSISVAEDSSVTGTLAPFYTDVDGDAQTLTAVQSPSKGTIVFNTDGTYTYKPYANTNGTDYFTFRTRDSGGLSSNVALATVTITPENDAPTITAESTWSINEDSIDQIFLFSVGDVEDAAGDLIVTGTKNDAQIAAISFWGTGSSRWMKVTPKTDFQSTTDIVITVKDTGKDGTSSDNVKSASQTVHYTVVPVNDPPTINGSSNSGNALTTAVTINEDTSTGAISFSVNDEESGGDSLEISGSSDNTTLVPVSGIRFGTDAGKHTLTVTPAANQFGSARITVSVKDDKSTRTAYVDVTVLPINDAPVVKPPADQTIAEDGSTEILYYTISDIDTLVKAITMSATSSDESIVAVSGITLSGNGAERTVAVKPVANAYGDVTITLIADDGGAVDRIGRGTFVVHVTAVDDAPTLQSIPNQTTQEDLATDQITVTVSDIDDAAGTLKLSAVSGNPALIDETGIAFGTGATDGERWMTLTPKPDANGVALITLKVTDTSGRSMQKSFTFTVTPVNDPPTITAIADQSILEDKATGTITFTVADIDDDVINLTVTGASDNTTVIPNANIVIEGNGAERTVKVTPAADQNGNIPVTLTVTDRGLLSDATTFTVLITPVNDKPTFTVGANQTVLEDCDTQSVTGWATNISRGKDNESAQGLAFKLSNNNTALFTVAGQPAVDADGRLTYTPAADMNGTATVTIYAKDDAGVLNGGANTSSTYTFTITVKPVNDQPSFEDTGSVTVAEDSTAYSAAWAIADSIRVGPENETQEHTFVLKHYSETNNAGSGSLFSVSPAIDGQTGALTFTPAANANGLATLTVVLTDKDGVLDGGKDTSEEHTFTIEVTASDDLPTFTLVSNVAVDEDSLAYSATQATGITPGGGEDEATQTLTFTLTGYNASLFTVEPTMTKDGLLTFTPAPNMNGTTTVTATLSDGHNTVTQNFTITIYAVNDKPSFTKGANQEVWEDCHLQTVKGWATNLVKGPSDEDGQRLTFTVTTNNNALFAVRPAIDANGQLTYTPANNAFGSATVTVILADNGGTDHYGANVAPTQTFTITVLPVNDQPSFSDNGSTINVDEDCGPIVNAWVQKATISFGPSNEKQNVTFSIQSSTVTSTVDGMQLFSQQPVIDAKTGAISFTPEANASGQAKLAIILMDDGLTERGGVDTSIVHYVTIVVKAINDAPSFDLVSKVSVKEDSAAYIATVATNLSRGGGIDEDSQTLTFTLSGYDESLFKVMPTIGADGVLRFTPAENMYGQTTCTVSLSDGITSVSSNMTIEILPVNDQPSFEDNGSVTVAEDSAAYSAAWAKTDSIRVGPANETQDHTFVLKHYSETNNAGSGSLFSVLPAIDGQTGALTFTPAANANGLATLTVVLTDKDGVLDGGKDTSEEHTFTIEVTASDDLPTFTLVKDVAVDEDSAAYSATQATGITPGGGEDEAAQVLTFTLTGYNASLFTVEPTMTKDGLLTFTPAPNMNGATTVTAALSDGHNTVTQSFTITIHAVNDKPSFTKGENQEVLEDCHLQTVKGWATNLVKGPTDEDGQALTFVATNNNNALFALQPAIDANGQLTYTPADNMFGSATVTVILSDNGGTDYHGVNVAPAQTFTITVLSVNDRPSFTKGDNQTVLEDAVAQTVTGWATDISAGPDNENMQTLAFTLSSNNDALFTATGKPAVDASGKLTYTPAPDANGTATVSVTLADNGGQDRTGVEVSQSATFTITVLPVNDRPAFADQGDITVSEDSGAYDKGWVKAGSMNVGPANEKQKPYLFSISSTGATSLFSVAPAIDPTTGAISFTPADNANGSVTLNVTLQDDDGTDNGGVNLSETHTVTITVEAVNDDPTFETAGTVTVKEDSGAYSAAYATGITTGGGADELPQTLAFTLSGYNAALFAAAPSLTGSGELSFTPAENAYGDTEVTATLSDGERSVTKQFTISILPVNDQPSFTDSGYITVKEDSGAYNKAWAVASSAYVGPANENQTRIYTLLSTTVKSLAGNTNLFSVAPAINATTGAITFTPAANANGTAEVTVVLKDADGVLNGGVNTSETHMFTITVNAVNDAPTLVNGGTVTVTEDSGMFDKAYAKGITTGGGTDESAQTLTLTLSGYDATLFTVVPALTTGGRLTFQPAPDANGTTTVTATLTDGTNTVTSTFQIIVLPVNDPPTFNPGGDQQVLQNSPAQSVNGWATNLYRGPGNESGQSLSFAVNNNNSALFTANGQPAVGANGRLTYTPAPNAYGTAKVTVTLVDNGGTDNGGDNSSAAYSFTITVRPASDQMMTTLTVSAAWTDHDNADGLRPLAVTVYLYSDTGVIRSQVLSQSNNWTYTFTALPVFDQNGVPVNYRVTEEAVSGYYALYDYGAATVNITNVHTVDPFAQIKSDPLVILADYEVPMGANSNMNEGECFN